MNNYYVKRNVSLVASVVGFAGVCAGFATGDDRYLTLGSLVFFPSVSYHLYIESRPIESSDLEKIVDE
ncbi:hypothetical protein HOC80_04745 [archaeon]|jgi:hypothetical protein|nr:hypothetical protein [archaeon]MBT4417382.1 hypothetical protein [archaeon]